MRSIEHMYLHTHIQWSLLQKCIAFNTLWMWN
jgi:hypothetical protein